MAWCSVEEPTSRLSFPADSKNNPHAASSGGVSRKYSSSAASFSDVRVVRSIAVNSSVKRRMSSLGAGQIQRNFLFALVAEPRAIDLRFVADLAKVPAHRFGR